MTNIKKKKTTLKRKPKFTPSNRVAQNLTLSTKWFKLVETIASSGLGTVRRLWNRDDLPLCRQWDSYAGIWEEYKIDKVICKIYPANIGAESLQTPGTQTPPVPPFAIFQRGNIVSWIDPNTPTTGTIATVESVMGRPSASLFQPRRFHKRWMSRPNGYPKWGTINNTGTIDVKDEWQGSINIFGTGFTPPQAPGNQTYFYAMVLFKVTFRSRKDT